MSRIINSFESLLNYDVPQVVAVRDENGALSVGVLVTDDPFTYFCAEISRSELLQLLVDLMDLRDLLEFPRSRNRFTFQLTEGKIIGARLETFGENEIPEDFLPDHGMTFFHVCMERKFFHAFMESITENIRDAKSALGDLASFDNSSFDEPAMNTTQESSPDIYAEIVSCAELALAA